MWSRAKPPKLGELLILNVLMVIVVFFPPLWPVGIWWLFKKD